MKVLVTGGAGFIGSNLVHELYRLGHEVIVLDNLLSGYRQNLDGLDTVDFMEGDVRNAQLVKEVTKGCSVIFHLAASVGNKRSIEHPIMDAEINVLGTLNVLEAARFRGIGKVVISSSAGIFGELKTIPIREDHPIEPDSPYGCTKLCEEKLGLSYGKLYPMEVVCLRYFNVYGPNQRFDAYGNVIPIFVFRMLRGDPLCIFGDGEQTRDFVAVQDVVQANLKAAFAKGVRGAFNIGSGTRITINVLAETIRNLGGKQAVIEYGPARQGDVRHSLADIGAATQAFGYVPQMTLEAGLPSYIAWARQEFAASSTNT